MSITTIIGPMFSGKTSELIRLVDRQRISGKRCLIIKNCIDNRFDSMLNYDDKKFVATHSEYHYNKCDICYYKNFTDKMADSLLESYDVIGIEEGFLFTGLISFCNKLADNGVIVIISTLDTNFRQEIFNQIADILARSEYIIKLTAVCMRCGSNDGIYTIRTIESTDEILIGGSDVYQSICRSCFVKAKKVDKDIPVTPIELQEVQL
jgi:thymidine kinase